ncbi:MAG: DUF4193 family protein [Actinomycetota bacterium]
MPRKDPEDEQLDEVEPDDEEEVLDDDALPEPVATEEVDVESIEDALAKKEEAAEEADDDEEPGITIVREESDRAEPLAVKVVPPQPTEFICKRCFLVKHRSQLKDRAKGLCRDCA